MKTYTLILILSLIASVCGAHDAWVSGSTDRQHLSGADLNNYLHGHKETVNGTVRTGYWDYDPDVDDAWEKTKANWEASGCLTQDANGNNLYDKDCYNDWIRDGNLKPTPKKPLIPINSPTQHSGCYGSGAEHFHRLDGNNYGHGLDHSGHVFVSGVMSGIHRHPACKTPCTDCGTPDGKKNLPDDPFGNTEGKDNPLFDDSISGVRGKTIIPATTLENALRITYLSHDDGVLTLHLTAYSPGTTHNHLVIRINDGRRFRTPAFFFGRHPLAEGEMREVVLTPLKDGSGITLERSAYKNTVKGKVYPYLSAVQVYPYGAETLIDFDITDFEVVLRDSGATTDRDSVRHTDIDTDGNRIGSVGGAPSHAKPKLVTVWAALKRQ